MVTTVPKRSEAVMVRLSPEEKDRLVRIAIKNDQRTGQLARRCINAQLATLDTEDARGASSDGAH